jgi:hypothetical protein
VRIGYGKVKINKIRAGRLEIPKAQRDGTIGDFRIGPRNLVNFVIEIFSEVF